jgi:hypothetical protein
VEKDGRGRNERRKNAAEKSHDISRGREELKKDTKYRISSKSGRRSEALKVKDSRRHDGLKCLWFERKTNYYAKSRSNKTMNGSFGGWIFSETDVLYVKSSNKIGSL